MDSLPALPLEKILAYLDGSDLMSCSLMNIWWRTAVNIDHLWKRICYEQCDRSTVDYVRSVQSRVEPRFPEPGSSHGQLEQLCYWRIVYMKLQHLKRNLHSANHETHIVIGRITFERYRAFNFLNMVTDDDVLVGNVNDYQCDVWNIRDVPRKEGTIISALTDTLYKCMIHVYDGRIVVVQDTLLQVYCRSGSGYMLCYRRLFNNPETDSRNIPESLNIDEWYRTVVGRVPSYIHVYHVGNYFIGLARDDETFERASFHVWDISTGSKLSEDSVQNICPEIRDPIHNVKFCTPKADLGSILVCVKHSSKAKNDNSDDPFYTAMHVYNLSTLTFKKIKIFKPHNSWVYYEDHVILAIGIESSRSRLETCDSSTGETLSSTCFEGSIIPDTVQVHRDYLGFKTKSEIVVLNVKDLQLIFSKRINEFSSSMFGFDFIFLDWDLLLISRYEVVSEITIWNIKENCILNSLNTSGTIFSRINSVKLFVWDRMLLTIYMLQFW